MNEMNEWTEKDVELLAEPLLKSEGLDLIDVEYRREPRGRVLRIIIDKQGGVTLDNCTAISKQLGDILDAKMEGNDLYHLEVSSPGIDRKLTKPKHFVYYKGRPAIIKTNRFVDGKKDFKGVLAGFSEGVVKLIVDNQPVNIPHDTIVKANLWIEY